MSRTLMYNVPSSREDFTALDSAKYIWKELGLPVEALVSLSLPGEGLTLPSSFKIGDLAQSTVALSALAAALIYALKTESAVPRVTVPRQHAAVEFNSEKLYTIDGKSHHKLWGPVGGLHKTSDGYVRMHDSFPHHRNGALALLGLPATATRADAAEKMLQWKAQELEDTAINSGLVMTMLRSYEQWDAHPQSKAISDIPISIKRIAAGPKGLRPRLSGESPKCLNGLRVLELSRVIAAPVAGKTLAAHGADVLWVTSPDLPDLPALDRDLSRGKRTIQLNLNDAKDKLKLLELASTADVFIQGYRPTSLATRGISAADLAALNSRIIYANLSAYGPSGPWSNRRGFDSLVQTCGGMNVSEAQHYGRGEPARPMPCQALDHGAGYLLATGILAALYRQVTLGGCYEVDVSLAGVMKYLRSLGQYPGRSGFECADLESAVDVSDYLETKPCEFGALTAVKHSASVEGCMPGWDVMPKSLGSDKAEWLD
ncbi:CoA-transferase family III [Viridothelium virens]|uniref:CoA-transferase family III n=1 Tax=Viridothelium virens TaxID=1048519 RepID=A0A6A6H5P1_VIRVR|nr:CoA-transferase family III [Viridothelium virens]